MNAAETVTKQVVVVSKNAEVTAFLNRFLAPSNWHAAAASPDRAAESCSLADAMVVDLPLDSRGAAVADIRRRFSGPLVVITRHDEGWSGLPGEDHGIVVLARPFAARELSAVFGIPAASDRISPQPAPGLTADAVAAPNRSRDAAAAWPGWATAMAGSEAMTHPSANGVHPTFTFATRTARRGAAPAWWNRAAAGLASCLRDHRRRRLAVGVAFLTIFVGAFALAVRGSCGAGCESLTNSSRVQRTSMTVEGPGMTASPGPKATGSTATPHATGRDPEGIQVGVGSPTAASLSTRRRAGAITVTQRSGSGSASAPSTTTAPSTTVSSTTAPSTTVSSTTAPPDDT